MLVRNLITVKITFKVKKNSLTLLKLYIEIKIMVKKIRNANYRSSKNRRNKIPKVWLPICLWNFHRINRFSVSHLVNFPKKLAFWVILYRKLKEITRNIEKVMIFDSRLNRTNIWARVGHPWTIKMVEGWPNRTPALYQNFYKNYNFNKLENSQCRIYFTYI